MNSNFLLDSKTASFIRKYRYLIVITWIVGGFTTAYGIRQSIIDRPDSSSIDPSLHPEIMFWVISIFWGIGCTLLSSALGLPAFLILRKIETLLVKLREQSSIKLSSQIELSQLKKLFIIQFILNIGTFLLVEIPRLNKYVDSQSSSGLGEHGTAAFYIATHIDAYLSWFTAPFGKGMPLIYLIILFAIIRISKKNEKLQDELEHTV